MNPFHVIMWEVDVVSKFAQASAAIATDKND